MPELKLLTIIGGTGARGVKKEQEQLKAAEAKFEQKLQRTKEKNM